MERREPALAAQVEAVRKHLEEWRKTRQNRRARIPEPLWESAVQLARRHGIHPISRALRLNYDYLKRRVGATAQAPATRAASEPVFVELAGASRPVAGQAHSVIELEDRRGEKMTIRLERSSDLDVVALTNAFWRRRR